MIKSNGRYEKKRLYQPIYTAFILILTISCAGDPTTALIESLNNSPIVFIEASDGNIIAAGYTRNSVIAAPAAYIARMNSTGTVVFWDRAYGGASNDIIRSIIQLTDESLVAVGINGYFYQYFF
ncbi:MAG: hypothetical protein KAQ98_06805 [Bacteriovoracaceae bacterium]|nr:hypothetical protein [Bacteriovoracaceae bacterium]